MPIQITKKPHDHNYKPSKWRSFLGSVICLSFSMIGRVVFGFGAVVTGWLAVVAFRELFGN